MTHADFLASIIADPTNDAPRLVYADWLEENGEEARAEFIRVQIELARFQVNYPDFDSKRYQENWPNQHRQMQPRREALRCRERELWEMGASGNVLGSFPHDVETEWMFALVGDTFSGRYPALLVHRGLVSTIRCTWADFVVHHAAIRQATPLEWVELTTFPNSTNRNGEWYYFDGDESHQVHIEELNGMYRGGDSLTAMLLKWRFPGLRFRFAGQERFERITANDLEVVRR